MMNLPPCEWGAYTVGTWMMTEGDSTNGIETYRKSLRSTLLLTFFLLENFQCLSFETRRNNPVADQRLDKLGCFCGVLSSTSLALCGVLPSISLAVSAVHHHHNSLVSVS
jgi:hypothetical protein